jgi:hypothetical protein
MLDWRRVRRMRASYAAGAGGGTHEKRGPAIAGPRIVTRPWATVQDYCHCGSL